MIKILNGIHETVDFSDNSSILMYNNYECEDYPIHWHTPIEIILPFENTYKVVCGNNTINLNEGDILIIAPGTLHHLYAPATGHRMILQVDNSLMSILKDLESVISLISPYVVITQDTAPDIYKDIHKLMVEIFDEYFSNSSLREACVFSKLIQVFVLLGRQYQYSEKDSADSANTKHQEYTKIFLDVCDYINKHCCENLSLDQIADLTGFSKYHFSRLFKQFTGISFYKYLNKKRIMRAEQLLIDPEILITEAAHRSGFSSISSFIRMFKIYKNCTPTEFRTMHSTYPFKDDEQISKTN